MQCLGCKAKRLLGLWRERGREGATSFRRNNTVNTIYTYHFVRFLFLSFYTYNPRRQLSFLRKRQKKKKKKHVYEMDRSSTRADNDDDATSPTDAGVMSRSLPNRNYVFVFTTMTRKNKYHIIYQKSFALMSYAIERVHL